MAAEPTTVWFAPTADPSDPAVRGYAVSYLLTRVLVGLLGLLLPLTLLFGEVFLDRSLEFRGSISAYYHSPMNDVLVGTLCVIGFLLLMYMAGTRNADFLISLVAGLALIAVAMFPTQRSGIADGAEACGRDRDLPGCAPIQNALGEDVTAYVHYGAAAVFFACLFVISIRFGRSEEKRAHNDRLARFHYGCAAAIGVALAIIVVGEFAEFSIGPFESLYIGEVLAVVAFALSWLVKGWGLKETLQTGTVSPTAS